MTMTLGELALVGTSRAGTPSESGTPIDALIEAGQVTDVAQRVLLTAAALDIYQRAGLIPSRIDALPEPAPLDPHPACSAAVAAIVSEMITSGHSELLPEACELIAGRQKRLPDTLIPICLDLKEPELRVAASAVLGERGRWLARQRDRWAWAAGTVASTVARASAAPIEDLRRTWEEGAPAARFEVMAQLRAIDPATAREWVADAWSRESVEQRVRLLAILETGLGPGDEPWLESILRDRSLGVRARVAWLLARLPESAFAVRVRARVDPLLAWEPASGATLWDRVKAIAAGGERSTGTLHVSPPVAADAAWEQDGISIKPPKGQGERGYWLVQLLAQVHPAHWSRSFDVTPRELVRAAWQSEWGSAIAIGWSQAIKLHGDPAGDWSTALWDGWATAAIEQDPLAQAARGEMLALLFVSMPAEAAEERLIECLRQPPSARPFDLAPALTRMGRGWSDRLASAVLDAIAGAPEGGLLIAASQRLPPSHVERGLAIAVEQETALAGGAAWRRALDLFITRIRLRQRLSEELADE